jgi:photosystem II stability/assembly factor-like uncharacterized protein
MPNIQIIRFNKGEITPKCDARMDVDAYSGGCRHLENMLPLIYGCAERRPGTYYIDESYNSEETIRLVPFVYSSSISYVMEFGNEYIRFFYDGSVLLDGSDEVVIYSPYQTADLFQLQFAQLNDVVWIVHPSYAPRKLVRTSTTSFELNEIEFTTGPFLLRNDLIDPDIIDTSTMTCSVTTKDSVGTLTCSAAFFDDDHIGAMFKLTHPRASTTISQSGDGESSSLDVKGTFSFNTHGTWTGTVILQRRENSDSSNDWEDYRTWKSSNDRNVQLSAVEESDNIEYRISADIDSGSFSGDITVNNSIQEGIVRIDGINSTTSTQITVIKAVANTNATKRWAEGSWSELRGYPTSIAFFEDRACYAGSVKVPQEGEWSDYGDTWTAKDSNRNWGAKIIMSDDGQYQLSFVSSGQLYVSSDYGDNWTAKDSNRNWSDIAISSTGQYMTTVVNGGYIYVSDDYGDTWTAKDSSRNWLAVAMSDDGEYQTAVIATNIYVSSDYGDTWTAKKSTNYASYVALSSSGRYQTVASGNNGYIYRSADYGQNWSVITIAGVVQDFRLIAVSASGKYQMTHISKIYISSDYGATWTSHNYTSTQWNANAISLNGKYMIAVGAGNAVYVSKDYGSSWTQTKDDISPADVAMSNDGKYITAVVGSGQIYVSEDYGDNWTAKDSSRAWNAVAMSATGRYQAATVYGGQIYISDSGYQIFEYGTGAGEQKTWLSRQGDYENFEEGANDSDSFSLTIPTSNEIRWVETLESVIVGTAGNEWRIGTNELNTPLTPTNFTVKEQTNFGCRNIRAIKVNDTILYADFVGRKIRELTYEDSQRKYVSPDLTALAEHITESGIVGMAYQKNPDSILWVVLDDGSLISMTYDRVQDVVAWSKHPMDGSIQSVCVVPAADEDEVWLSVRRSIDSTTENITYIEKLMPRDFGSSVEDAFFVDSGITFTPQLLTVDTTPAPAEWSAGATVTGATSGTTAQITKKLTATTYEIAYLTGDFTLGEELSDGTNAIDCAATHPTVADTSSTTIGGLLHLVGETVTVLGDGTIYTPTAVVDANGAITISTAIELAQVGLPYTYKLEPMRPDVSGGGGTSQGSLVRVPEMAISFLNTMNAKYGVNDDSLYSIKWDDSKWENKTEIDDLFTGIVTVSVDGGFSIENNLIISGSDPMPCTVRALVPRLNITGR